MIAISVLLFVSLSIFVTAQQTAVREVEKDLATELRSIGIPRPLSLTRFGCRRQVRSCRKRVGDSLPFEEWYAQVDQLGDQYQADLRDIIEKAESADYGHVLSDIRGGDITVDEVTTTIRSLQALPDTVEKDGLFEAANSLDKFSDEAIHFLVQDTGSRHLRRRLDDFGHLDFWILAARLPFLAIRLLFSVNPILTAALSPFLAIGIFAYFIFYPVFFVVFYAFWFFGGINDVNNRLSRRLLFSEVCLEELLQCKHEHSLSLSIPAMIEATKIVEAKQT